MTYDKTTFVASRLAAGGRQRMSKPRLKAVAAVLLAVYQPPATTLRIGRGGPIGGKMRNRKKLEYGIAEIAGLDLGENTDQDFDELLLELDMELLSSTHSQYNTIH